MIRLNVCMYLPKLSTYPSYAIPSSTPVPYNFDIFIGTLNKPISAATEGYNELIFAYVRTASGRIFALSGDPNVPGSKMRRQRQGRRRPSEGNLASGSHARRAGM